MSSSRPICPPWRPSARHLRAKPPSRRTRMPGALWPTLAGSAPASAAGPVIMESPDPWSYWPVTTNSKQWAMAGPWDDLCESGRARPGHLSRHVLAAMARLVRIGANIAGRLTSVSWPASCRPSTTLQRSAPPVVDGRAKLGHDTLQTIAPYTPYVSAYADTPGHDGQRGRGPSQPACGSL